MTRCEFYAKVVDLVAKGFTQQEAYERVEKEYKKQHKQRKYVSYHSFYHVNYRAVVREMSRGKIEREKIKELERLCDEFGKGKISQLDMVDELKKHIL